MRRWNSFFEIIQFPLITLFIATVIMGISGILVNPNTAFLFTIENNTVLLVAELLKYFGGFIVSNFPLLILIKLLSKRYEDSVPVFIGIIGFIIFNVTTMFIASTDMPLTAYSSVLGLSIDAGKFMFAGTGVHFPIQTGIVAAIVLANITRFTYTRSRNRSSYGIFAFIDRDTWAMIVAIIYSVLAGVVISFIWPYFINVLYGIFHFIANDITNPMNLFVYGIFDRLLSILNLPSLIRGAFWFGEMGGSWINAAGTNYLGDVAVWTAQSANGILNTGAGRLITPYFVLNIFAVPAYVIALFRTVTDKIERRKYWLFALMIVVISIFSGTLLPFELYLLIIAPMLFIFHLLATGLLFAVFQALSVFVGYAYAGSIPIATPASLFDLLVFYRNPQMTRSITLIILVGAITFIAYFLITRYYYNKGALDLLNTGSGEIKINGIIDAIGGIENVRSMGSTPTKVIIQVFDTSLMNFNKMQKYGASKIVETRNGYAISLGSCSNIVRRAILKKVKLLEKSK